MGVTTKSEFSVLQNVLDNCSRKECFRGLVVIGFHVLLYFSVAICSVSVDDFLSARRGSALQLEEEVEQIAFPSS